jgi:hypothetical protein
MRGDGACLYRSVTQFYLSDQNLFSIIRSRVHQLIVKCWDQFFCSKYTFPLNLSIGSGAGEAREIECKTAEQYLNFLQSTESLYSWSESDVDLVAIASFMNRAVWIFNFREGFSR